MWSGQELIMNQFEASFKIRHEDFRPLSLVLRSFVRNAPWILKRGELESSGQRLISSFGKAKGIAFFFFFEKKKIFKIFIFFEKSDF